MMIYSRHCWLFSVGFLVVSWQSICLSFQYVCWCGDDGIGIRVRELWLKCHMSDKWIFIVHAINHTTAVLWASLHDMIVAPVNIVEQSRKMQSPWDQNEFQCKAVALKADNAIENQFRLLHPPPLLLLVHSIDKCLLSLALFKYIWQAKEKQQNQIYTWPVLLIETEKWMSVTITTSVWRQALHSHMQSSCCLFGATSNFLITFPAIKFDDFIF